MSIQHRPMRRAGLDDCVEVVAADPDLSLLVQRTGRTTTAAHIVSWLDRRALVFQKSDRRKIRNLSVGVIEFLTDRFTCWSEEAAFYNRAAEHLPKSILNDIGTAEHRNGRRGEQKKQHLLAYLRGHPEELHSARHKKTRGSKVRSGPWLFATAPCGQRICPSLPALACTRELGDNVSAFLSHLAEIWPQAQESRWSPRFNTGRTCGTPPSAWASVRELGWPKT